MEFGEQQKWDFEYLRICFPRDFTEENCSDYLRVLRDLRDILKSSYIRLDLKLIYKYVLMKLVEYYQMLCENTKEFGQEQVYKFFFPPMDEGLVKKIYKEFGYKYNGKIHAKIQAEVEHPQLLN